VATSTIVETAALAMMSSGKTLATMVKMRPPVPNL